MKPDKSLKNIIDLITKGVQLSFQELVKKTAAEDGELYFSENGKVVAVKAKKLLKKKSK